MKRCVLTVCSICFLGVITAFSQTVNHVPIEDLEVEYIQLVGDPRFLSNKVTVEIDFGQENKLLIAKDRQVKDEKGKPVLFNSMVEALNLFTANGYEYVDTIAGRDQQHVKYVLRKKEKQ